jgi:hypothetical protein
MMINTLFASNIPGEINMPFGDITKTKNGTKEFSGEEIMDKLPPYSDPSEIIVDNEDPGFSTSIQNSASPLKKLLGIDKKNGKTYKQISSWNIPEYWQSIVSTTYYGQFIRSAVYTKAGSGDKTVSWSTVIKTPGYYDIYSFVGKMSDRMTRRPGQGGGRGGPGGSGGEKQEESQYKDLHYKIYHDKGDEEITLDYENAENGWNMLGRYYLSSDTTKVVLTNKSSGRSVIGDAIKWVREN